MKDICYKPVIIVLIMGLISGCDESFLDRNHPGDLTGDKLYHTTEDFNAALAGCYRSIIGPATSNIFLGEIPSDNVYISRFNPSGDWVDMDRLAITPQNGALDGYWTDNYSTIQRVNILLDELAGSSVEEEAQKVIVAEVRFLRAYSYFNLVRVFGAVPLYESRVDLDKMYDVPRAPVEDVYQLIIDDLNEAANVDSYRTTEQLAVAGGKVSAVAAKTLLGKVYLWKRDYPNAETVLADVVMNSGKTLVDLSVLFGPDSPFNDENIFSINFARTTGFNNPFVSNSIPYQMDVSEIYPNIEGLYGSGFFMIEPYVAGKFTASDKRLTELTDEATFEVLGNVDTNIYSLKYIDHETTFNGFSGANLIILRYADVLLMYAEALNENNKTEEAYPYINEVRSRAGIADLPTGYSKDEMFQALADERQREFLMEGDRWFDLRYRGMDFLEQEMNAFKPNAYLEQNQNVQVRDYFSLFPIPEEQVQVKPILEQNSGY